MQKFQEAVKLFLKEELGQTEVQIHQEFPDFLPIAHDSWSHKVLIVLHHLDESDEAHLEKISKFSSKAKLKTIHLWEDLWSFHSEKVKSRLISVVGKSVRLHGRESKIHTINNEELVAFLTKNHLNVPIKAKYKYGLFHKDSLVAVMSFSKSRIIKRGGQSYSSFELLRFCNKLNHTVVGGFTKLLEHFIKTVRPDDIMTYVDKDWSDGQAYEKAGFALIDQLAPMEFLLDVETGQRIYPGRNEQIAKSESIKNENTIVPTQYVKVFNSGSYKYIRTIKQNQ